MAATLKERLGLEVDLIEGEKGIFDVVAGGELIYSKHAEGRFPEDQEIVEELTERGRDSPA